MVLQRVGYFEAGHLRHLDVRDEDVRAVQEHSLQGFFTIARLGYDGNIAFHFQESSKGAENHGLIFGDDHPNLLARWIGTAHPGCSVPAACLRVFVARGSVIVSRVPAWACGSSWCSVPPRASILSRMPRRPTPSVCKPPRPSSWISRRHTPFKFCKLRRHVSAWAWRTTLVTASRS